MQSKRGNVNHTADLRSIACMSRVVHTCFQGCVRRHGRGDEWLQLWLPSCRTFITSLAVEACDTVTSQQPRVTGGMGLCKGGMISPIPLPRSPGLGTGTRFGGSYFGGSGPTGVGSSVQRAKRQRWKKGKIGISQSPAQGQGSGPMGPFFGIICMWCSASAAHWPPAPRPPLVLQSNCISTKLWPNPTIFQRIS